MSDRNILNKKIPMKRIILLIAFLTGLVGYAQTSYVYDNNNGTDAFHKKFIGLNGYYEFSRNQFIILSSEINQTGGISIQELKLYLDSYYSNTTGEQLKGVEVYMGHTTNSDYYYSGYNYLTGLTKVFPETGVVNYEVTDLPAMADWHTIDIVDFNYDGISNLVIEIRTNDDDNDWMNNIIAEWQYGILGSSTSDYKTITGYSDVSAGSITPTRRKERPRMELVYGSQVSVTASQIEPAKYLGSGGNITVEGAGALSGLYHYDWSDLDDVINEPDQDGPVRTGLSVGTYSVIGRDQQGVSISSVSTDFEIIESYDFSFRSSGIDRLPNRVLKKTTSSATNEWFSTNHQLEDGKELSWVVGSAGDAYQVGLSNVTETITGGSFDLGWSTSNENGGTAKVLVGGIEVASSSISAGNVLKITRNLNTFYFIIDDFLVHTETAYSGNMYVEGTINDIGVELPTMTLLTYPMKAFGDMTMLPTGNADLNVTVIRAIGTPTYVWTGPGVTDANLQNQIDIVPGIYSVLITDQGTGSSNLSFTITTDKTIEWDYMTSNMSSNAVNSVKRTSGSGTTSSWARSKNAMIGVGSVQFTIPSTESHFIVGLSQDKHTEGNYYAIDYAFDWYGSGFTWYMEGDEVRNQPASWESFSANTGDILEIARVNEGGQGKIYFYRIDPITELKTSLYPSEIIIDLNQPLYFEASISDATAELPEMRLDFGVPLSATAVINHSNKGLRNGSINLNVDGGFGSYTYLWNTGFDLANLYGQEQGEYSVTISDGASQLETSYEIMEYVIWDESSSDNSTTILDNGSIQKIISSGTCCSQLSQIESSNVLDGNGKVSFKIANTTDEYIIGLTSDFNDGDTYHDIDYAAEIYQFSSSPSVWFYHEGSSNSHWFYVSVGDEITIEKAGTKIRYYINGVQTIQYSSPYERDIVADGLSSNQVFSIEASIDQQNAKIENVVHSFPNLFDVTASVAPVSSNNNLTRCAFR